MSSFPKHEQNILALQKLGIDVSEHLEGGKVTEESWGYDEQVYILSDAIKLIDEQSKQIKQLTSQVELLKKLGSDVLADAVILFQNQEQDYETGEYAVDGESCHLLGEAIDKCASFCLNAIKAEAIEEAVEDCGYHLDVGDLMTYAKQLRGEE